ncbi:MAG: hypothetical protein JO061_09615, partial [Acidobacteriaceae bacterium]|nr:hypothetical protein [Acidobacteriaceae bacterium]
ARVFHLALIGFSLFVGALYDGFRNRKLAALAVCGICFFQACALLHNLLIWRETALLAAGTCSEFGRDAPQMETLTVLDLPSTWNGVYFLKNGFADCVLINSGRRLTISETSQPGGQAPVFRWNGVSETIVRER